MIMVMSKAAAFMRQPSTVLGVSTLIGTLTAFLTGEISWQGMIPALAGSLAAIALPDNSNAQVAIEGAAKAIVVAEEAVVNSPAKTTVVANAAKITARVMLVPAVGFGLSACAGLPSTSTRSAKELRIAYATAYAAATAYLISSGAGSTITTHFAALDESALVALAAYEATSKDDVRAQAAETAIAALTAYGAMRATR